MGRANRCLLPGQVSHLTHRCHNRAHLLRFIRDRDAYLFWLREGLQRFGVTLLGYCVTCNHVHLIVYAATTAAVSELMGLLEGQVGAQYNRRKGIDGAFWSDRFHATMIDSGEYFWNCLTYVDLNMVRAGVVADPREWRWGSYAELLGQGEAKALVDWPRVAELIGCASIAELRQHWQGQINSCLEHHRLKREACWTEAVAVGRRGYVEWVTTQVEGRRRWEIKESALPSTNSAAWTVRESGIAYG